METSFWNLNIQIISIKQYHFSPEDLNNIDTNLFVEGAKKSVTDLQNKLSLATETMLLGSDLLQITMVNGRFLL